MTRKLSIPVNSTLYNVYMAIKQSKYGITCDSLEILLNMQHQTVSARVWDLKRLNLVKATSKTRPTRSGRNAAVLMAR